MELPSFLKFGKSAVVIGTVLGFVAGFLSSDWLDQRSQFRETVNGEIAEVGSTATELSTRLQFFSDVALGKRKTSAEKIENLQRLIITLHDQVNSVKNSVPEIEPQYKDFAEAMINLKLSAENLTSSEDGAKFVESVSAFYEKLDRFDQALKNAHRDYKLPLT